VLFTRTNTSTEYFYGYDVAGRMLTRTDSNGTTTFVWDGMDCVQETDYQANVTRYYVVNSKLRSFDRQGVVYQVHWDAIGSIRNVTDPTGAVVANYDYDAWGNPLASTSDTIPDGGLLYRFVGSFGTRWDPATGLYYIRQRWYDPVTQRFVSRDPISSLHNPYGYCRSNPVVYVDITGAASGIVNLEIIPKPLIDPDALPFRPAGSVQRTLKWWTQSIPDPTDPAQLLCFELSTQGEGQAFFLNTVALATFSGTPQLKSKFLQGSSISMGGGGGYQPNPGAKQFVPSVGQSAVTYCFYLPQACHGSVTIHIDFNPKRLPGGPPINGAYGETDPIPVSSFSSN
jgi:RHS repeat-associated protein